MPVTALTSRLEDMCHSHQVKMDKQLKNESETQSFCTAQGVRRVCNSQRPNHCVEFAIERSLLRKKSLSPNIFLKMETEVSLQSIRVELPNPESFMPSWGWSHMSQDIWPYCASQYNYHTKDFLNGIKSLCPSECRGAGWLGQSEIISTQTSFDVHLTGGVHRCH